MSLKTPFSSYTLAHEPIMRQMLFPARAAALEKGLRIARARKCTPEKIAEFERLLRLAKKKGA